jgi:P27 family predicted phage terminase small subunit
MGVYAMSGNSNSGRPGIPAALQLIHGNAGKKSLGALMEEIKNPPVPVAAPPMPDWLSDNAVAEWERIIGILLTLGLVSKLDMMALATYCEAAADWQRFRRKIAEHNANNDDKGDVQTFATGAKQISVWRQLANDAEKRATAAGAQFGLSPMARRNLKTTQAPQGELFPNEPREAASQYFT